MTDEKIVVEENIIDETENVKETEETKMPAYMIAEHLKTQGDYSIFNLNLEQLIYEKMVLLFEKLQRLQNDLKFAEIALKDRKDTLLLETDFKKELGESRPTVAMKEAWMKPYLAELEADVDLKSDEILFYKNKLTIINDLIKHKRLLLQVEGGLKE